MKLSSPAFEHNDDIPSRYTCKGENVCPHLRIENLPDDTKCLALIMDDPDAPGGTFVHWVIWNIPVKVIEIMPATTPMGSRGGTNDFEKVGYSGPCPPSGTHRYFFKAYALDAELDLEAGAAKADLEAAMKDHTLDQAELIGLFTA